MRSWWTQLIVFQLLWFSAVIGRNDWLLLTLGLVLLQYLLSPGWRVDWRVMPLALIGIAADTLLTAGGVLVFDALPVWLGLLWLAFVLTLGQSMRWLRRLPLPAVALLGAIAGSLSYLAGWKLEAVEFPLGLVMTLLSLAVVWSLLLPMLVHLDERLRRPI